MTYRERRQARIYKLQEWAEKRDEKSEESFDAAYKITERIPPGQPILIGHHSERYHRRALERSDNKMRQGFEHRAKGEAMRERADNIADHLGRSIYSDDPDAIELLERRIAGLEAERDRIKAYNASCRRGSPDFSLLDESQRRDIESAIARGWTKPDGQFPPSPNLTANINRNRKRLEALTRWKEAA